MSNDGVFRASRLLLIVVLAVALTACGSQPSNEPAPATPAPSTEAPSGEAPAPAEPAVEYHPFTYQGADREQKLVEGAKQEGKVTWYTSLAGPVVNAMVAAFQEKYPDIKVDVFRGDQSKVISLIGTEAQANKHVADVLEITSDGALLLREQGLLAPFFSPVAIDRPEQYRVDADNGLVWEATDRVSYISFAYNKNQLPAESVPQTIQDLLKPELKDKIAVVSSTTGIRFIGGVLALLGEEEGKKFLEEFSKQNIRVESVSGAALMGLIAQGEVAASTTIFQNHTQQEAGKGAPVDWLPVGPVIANAGDVVAMKTAPNPHAAMLFVDFILGAEGAKVLNELEYSTPNDQVDYEFWLPESDFESSKDYQAAYDGWKQLFDETFR